MRISRQYLNDMSQLLDEAYDYGTHRGAKEFFPPADKAQGNDFWNVLVAGMVAASNPSQLNAFVEHHLDAHDDVYKQMKRHAVNYISKVGDDQKAYANIIELYGDQLRDVFEDRSRSPWRPDEFNEEPVEGEEENEEVQDEEES